MFDQIYHYPKVIARHRQAPWAVERERYLAARAAQGYHSVTLLRSARELLAVVGQIRWQPHQQIDEQTITAGAEHWARQQQQRGRCHTRLWSQALFVQVARDWFGFLGCLQKVQNEPPPWRTRVDDFVQFLQHQRGLSDKTIGNYSWHASHFLAWLQEQGRPLAEVSLLDVDAFLFQRGWSRIGNQSRAKCLRAFFRHAEQAGWCISGIAAAIESPRVFAHESLPIGVAWQDVQRLVDEASGQTPQQIRDRAILLLLAVYGMRSSEVAHLCLVNLDWEAMKLHVYRSKSRRTQVFPLPPSVGAAIKRYLEQARPTTNCREIFLTLKAPFRPLSPGGMYHLVCSRMDRLGIRSRHRGPHALRHACATRLVAQGLSLKEIGDHLGHRSAFATRIYAKVDLAGLREVARFDLGGVL
jgi:site-specific recombinase XerD